MFTYRFIRAVAYRWTTRWLCGYIGWENKQPLPACVYHSIPGEKRLYQLKNKSLEGRAKGHLILTLDVEYNPIRAAVRTVNPREPKVMFEPAKFKRAVRM